MKLSGKEKGNPEDGDLTGFDECEKTPGVEPGVAWLASGDNSTFCQRSKCHRGPGDQAGAVGTLGLILEREPELMGT